MDEAAKPETEIRKAQNSVGAMVLPRLLADVSQNAAVNVEDQAVDKVGSLGGEEDGGAAQILGLAPALGRGLGNQNVRL